jgi:hypothetical protein
MGLRPLDKTRKPPETLTFSAPIEQFKSPVRSVASVEINDLAAFVSVARASGFRDAARKSGVSPSVAFVDFIKRDSHIRMSV